MARAALLLSRHRGLRTLVFRGLSRARGLFTHLLELNMGRSRWYRVRPSSLVGFLVGLVWPGTGEVGSLQWDKQDLDEASYPNKISKLVHLQAN